jgi:hypothetical protein
LFLQRLSWWYNDDHTVVISDADARDGVAAEQPKQAPSPLPLPIGPSIFPRGGEVLEQPAS